MTFSHVEGNHALNEYLFSHEFAGFLLVFVIIEFDIYLMFQNGNSVCSIKKSIRIGTFYIKKGKKKHHDSYLNLISTGAKTNSFVASL